MHKQKSSCVVTDLLKLLVMPLKASANWFCHLSLDVKMVTVVNGCTHSIAKHRLVKLLNNCSLDEKRSIYFCMISHDSVLSEILLQLLSACYFMLHVGSVIPLFRCFIYCMICY